MYKFVKVIVWAFIIVLVCGCANKTVSVPKVLNEQSTVVETDPTVPITDKKQVVGGSDFVYLDLDSNELVFTNFDDVELNRVSLPDKVTEDYQLRREGKLAESLENMWNVIEGGVVLKYYYPQEEVSNFAKYFVYTIDKSEFYDLGIIYEGYVSMDSNRLEYSDGYRRIYDISNNRFYIEEDTNYPYESGFVFDEIYYYEPIFGEGETMDDGLRENPKYKTFDQRKVYQTQLGEERICKVESFELKQIVQLDISEFIGVINGENFLAISDFAVKSYDVNENGVVYVGFQENANVYYYEFDSETTFELDLSEDFYDVRFVKDAIVVLEQGCVLHSYDPNRLKEGELTPLKTLDLRELTDEKIDSFHMDSDGEYLVAFVDEYVIDQRAVYKTMVISDELSILRELDSAYLEIIEGGYVFTNAYPLQIRYSIEKDLVEVIGKSYWFDEVGEPTETMGLKTFFHDR
ncbi:MAG: hypothetical protein JW708_11760, partial [Vallitaleaceae bacterium]|nr:hypothetical protein [Vallitaleaceae bacterium]